MAALFKPICWLLPISLATIISLAESASFGNGVNLMPSYYNGGNVNVGYSLMNQYKAKIKTLRIEAEPSTSISVVQKWIREARSNGYAVILTYHKASVLGSDSTSELMAGANWWKQNYKALSSAGQFTVNLMNEWGSHSIKASAYASAYNQAIAVVRQVYSGTIIIDIPGWGQETDTAAAAIKGSEGTKISDPNILPSVHVYPAAWNQVKNRFLTTADLDTLAGAGRALIVGEFGTSGSSGSADVAGIVKYAKSKGYAVLGWCWNGDGGALNMVSPAWVSNAQASTFSKSAYFSTIYNMI